MTEFIEVKTAELIGSALDYTVEIAIGGEKPGIKHAFAWRYQNVERKDYSRLWRDGGPLIEEHSVCLAIVDGEWFAAFEPGQGLMEWNDSGSGDTPLVAACRAIVAAKLGETVRVPVELMK
jgi:hypothetical protein